MTLTELRYITAVARYRHFGRAAERCFVSQPTLSIAVRKLDPDRLGKLNLSGGAIRNVALRASFLAAGQDGPVTMDLIYEAAREEYRKLHRVMTEEEMGEG